jgi:tetratricopeptide (TPR) repeat protein
MTEEERSSFLRDVDSDPELEEELDLHRIVEEGIKRKNEGKFRNKLEESYLSFESRTESSNSGARRNQKKIFKLFAVAAAILVGLFFVSRPFAPDTDRIFNKYYATVDVAFGSRSPEISDNETRLIDGITAYRHHNYSLARFNLESYLRENSNETEVANYYLGVTYLELQLYSEAEKCFGKVVGSPFNYYKDHSKWFLALTLIKQNKLEEARELLIDISRKNNPYSRESAKILKKISRFN